MSVKAMAMDVVTEKSNHVVTPLAPNMCITPCAPSPIPMPYPVTGTSSKLDPGLKKVKVKGKKTMNFKQKVKKVNGNQAGTQKDIASFQTGGHAFPLPVPAVTIHFEGGPVTISNNPGFANSM